MKQATKPTIKRSEDEKMAHVYLKVNGVTCPFVDGKISYLKAKNLEMRYQLMFKQLNVKESGKLIITQ